MQVIHFQFKDFLVLFMTLKSIGFKIFANWEEVKFFVVQVVLVLTLQATLKPVKVNKFPYILDIYYSYQKSESNNKNDEISNPLDLSETICEEHVQTPFGQIANIYLDVIYPANTQRWFNVDICWNNVATSVNVISTLIQRRFVNVDSSIKINVETTLILGWL